MKIVTVVGARPQFIKAAVVSRGLSACGWQEILVHTGQHYDANMSDVFFQELGIMQPSMNLGIGSGSHGAQTGRMLEALEGAMQAHRPDVVLVYGDTNSTLAATLAAAKVHIPVVHVEAGLRSFNRRMPEEVNRIVADHLSEMLFVPTQEAARNLRQEGVDKAKIHHVGDVMYDAALYFAERSDAMSAVLRSLALHSGQFALATIHRAENTDDPQRLRVIVTALAGLSLRMPVIWPVHPRTREAMQRLDITPSKACDLRMISPVGYLDMIQLEKNSAVIVTDSGGVQKEAFFYRVPCVTLRDETEWVESVALGWNRLCSPVDSDHVVEVITAARGTGGSAGTPYGEGDAAERVAAALTKRFGGSAAVSAVSNGAGLAGCAPVGRQGRSSTT